MQDFYHQQHDFRDICLNSWVGYLLGSLGLELKGRGDPS